MLARIINSILVIGDICLDTTTKVHCTRKNPEDINVPLYTAINTASNYGMAFNVYKCLIALNLQVDMPSLDNIESTIYRDVMYEEKIRIFSEEDKYLFRIDLPKRQEALKPHAVLYKMQQIDYSAIVISDYCKGTITNELIKAILAVAKCPVFLDSKKTNLHEFTGALIKINSLEFEAQLMPHLMPRGSIVTAGELGAYKIGSKTIIPPLKNIHLVDVCGAGDAFLAGYVYGYLTNKKLADPEIYGVVAGSLSVEHRGTYQVSEKELISGVERHVNENR